MLVTNCSANIQARTSVQKQEDQSSVVQRCCAPGESRIALGILALGCVTCATLIHKVDLSRCRNSLEAHGKSIRGEHGIKQFEKMLAYTAGQTSVLFKDKWEDRDNLPRIVDMELHIRL